MLRLVGRSACSVHLVANTVIAVHLMVVAAAAGAFAWLRLHGNQDGSRTPIAATSGSLQAEAAPIAALVRQTAGPKKSEQIRIAREFIFQHSLHKIDAEHDRYGLDTPAVLGMLLHHQQTGQEPPHLSCGPRALAMKAVLDALAIESRVVQVFSDDFDVVSSHTFLEVYDDDAHRWVVHDPDYDLSYVDARTGEPVPLMRLIMGDLRWIAPVSARGRGWAVHNAECLKTHYFEAAKYRAADGDCDVILVNADRFSMAKQFVGNHDMTFAEFSRQNYLRPAFLVNSTIHSPGHLCRQMRHPRPDRAFW
jgi:hypothetical protein